MGTSSFGSHHPDESDSWSSFDIPVFLPNQKTEDVSPEIRLVCDLLELVGDPDRLRVLLLLNDTARTILDLVIEISGASDKEMIRQVDLLQSKGLVETLFTGSIRIIRLTEIGRQLAQAAINLGADEP